MTPSRPSRAPLPVEWAFVIQLSDVPDLEHGRLEGRVDPAVQPARRSLMTQRFRNRREYQMSRHPCRSWRFSPSHAHDPPPPSRPRHLPQIFGGVTDEGSICRASPSIPSSVERHRDAFARFAQAWITWVVIGAIHTTSEFYRAFIE